MKKTWKIVAIALLAIANVCPVMAGGILTNTNQNVAFLRNPARDGAIGIADMVATGEGDYAVSRLLDVLSRHSARRHCSVERFRVLHILLQQLL